MAFDEIEVELQLGCSRGRRAPQRVISIKMDLPLLQKVDEVARQLRLTRSDLIRIAVECLLSELLSG